MILLAAGTLLGLYLAGARFEMEFVLWFLLVATIADRTVGAMERVITEGLKQAGMNRAKVLIRPGDHFERLDEADPAVKR